MEILAETVPELRASRSSVKWRAYGDEVLPVWVAEMDARPCEPVVEAVTAAVSRGDLGYSGRTKELAGALAGFADRRWGWQPDLTGAVGVSDVMVGIQETIHAATEPGSPVVVSPPCYDAFYAMISSLHRPIETAPLTADFRLDLDRLAAVFTAVGPGATYLLCNPQNPTGTLHTAEELTQLAEMAAQKGILVISDEIHAPLVQPDATFVPYLSLPAASRGIAVHSASKAFNLAGLRSALVVPGPHAQQTARSIHAFVTHGTQHLGVIAQIAAWTAGDAWLDQLLAEVADRRRLLTELLAAQLPEVVPTPARATYLAWLDCTGLGLDDPAETFLSKGKVALSPGRNYDASRPQWARFNLATSRDVITEAVTRMAAAMG